MSNFLEQKSLFSTVLIMLLIISIVYFITYMGGVAVQGYQNLSVDRSGGRSGSSSAAKRFTDTYGYVSNLHPKFLGKDSVCNPNQQFYKQYDPNARTIDQQFLDIYFNRYSGAFGIPSHDKDFVY